MLAEEVTQAAVISAGATSQLSTGRATTPTPISEDGARSAAPRRRLVGRLLATTAPGRAICLYEAQLRLREAHRSALVTLGALVADGHFDHPTQHVWIRVGAPPDPYELAARIAAPYALAQWTALALHLGLDDPPAEVLVASPAGFEPFRYAGVLYRPVGPWADDGAVEVLALPSEPRRSRVDQLGVDSDRRTVLATPLERALVDCARASADAAGTLVPSGHASLLDHRGLLAELSLSRLSRDLDETTSPELVDRLVALVQLVGLEPPQSWFFGALRRRAGI